MGTVSPLHRFADGLVNVLTGRGTSVDRVAHNFWMRRFTTQQQVEQAYLSSWLHRKIVDIPAQDMTRAGRDWDATDEEIEKIEAEEKRLGYWSKVREALRLGRLGGGAIFIGLGDDPTQALPESAKPAAVQYLMVFSRWQLTLGDIETDPALPGFGQPRYFEINGLGRTLRIHPSRMVCFHGLPIPAISVSTSPDDRFWGMSVVEACDEAVQHATTACAGFASLIDEAKIDVFKFAGVVDTLSQPGGEDKLRTRMEATTTGKSIHRAIWLDKDDDWDQRELTLTGVRDVIVTYDARVAGAADIPATRLFGKSPDGQNSTGESDLANYFQAVGAKQEMDLRPAMERLDAVVLPSAGVDPKLTWQFSPLQVLSEKDQAEIENREADTVTKLANSGLIPESALAKAVQNRLIESQRFPGLQDAIAEAEAAGEELPDDPADLDIVPLPKGGDPRLAGQGGNASQPPARRAANDAQPRTLYVSRKLLNGAEFLRWAKSQGFESTLVADDLHVTITFSRTPVDWMKMGSPWSENDKGELVVPAGGARIVEPLGDKGAVVLLFNSSALSWRHEEMVRNGASHDFDEYQPHVSITYAAGDIDLSKVEPYRGELRFGPEIFEEVVEDWEKGREE